MTDTLNLEDLLNSHDCTDVIKYLTTSPHESFESRHMNYLMVKNKIPGSGIVQTLSCDLSGISWKSLIERNLLDYDAMKVIIGQGGLFKSHDIHAVIIVCEDNVSMLELIMNHCTPKPTDEDISKFSEQSLKCKKFGFIKVLISHGAKLNLENMLQAMLQALSKSDISSETELISYIKSTVEGRVGLFFKALKYSEYGFAESLVSGTENESVANKISLSSVLECPLRGNLEARKKFISFVKWMLENGFDPNGSGEANSLDIVLKLPKDNQTEQIELLTLLLHQGAAIERCTYNETTLPHIATKFAIDSGKF